MLAFVIGCCFDLLAALLVSIPLTIWLTIDAAAFVRSRGSTVSVVLVSAWIGLFLGAFISAAEWVFWHELGVRFNFVAVDYLVYTNEVVGNIWQSYPMPAILVGLAVVATGAFWLLAAVGLDRCVARFEDPRRTPVRHRRRCSSWFLSRRSLLVSQSDIPELDNNNNRELAKNGVFSFFAAFRSMELDYGAFYRTMDDRQALLRARRLTGSGTRTSDPTTRGISFTGSRIPGPVRPFNVVQFTVESLSIHFLGAFTDPRGLTPNIDAIAKDGLLFARCFATGTRTTRGHGGPDPVDPADARSIDHPPRRATLVSSPWARCSATTATKRSSSTGATATSTTCRRSSRPTGTGLSIGTRWLRDDVTHATAWGACDEDLYRWTIREADRVHATGSPFHFFVMTTSNHRPYTYPDGRIDIPSGTRPGRARSSTATSPSASSSERRGPNRGSTTRSSSSSPTTPRRRPARTSSRSSAIGCR